MQQLWSGLTDVHLSQVHGFVKGDRLYALRVFQFGESGLFLVTNISNLYHGTVPAHPCHHFFARLRIDSQLAFASYSFGGFNCFQGVLRVLRALRGEILQRGLSHTCTGEDFAPHQRMRERNLVAVLFQGLRALGGPRKPS